MAHDVFVSHSSKDKPAADAVCAMLESQGIRCWVAPRDILPGKNWGGSIIEAIHGAKAMILIFSTNANNSDHIKREVERAANQGMPIIPVRIENILPTDALEFFLSSPHWLDAFPPPLDRHLQHLAEVVRQIVGVAAAEPWPGPPPAAAGAPPGATPAPIPTTPAVVAPAPASLPPLIPLPAVVVAPKDAGARPPRPPLIDERWSRILIHVGCAVMMVGLLWPAALAPVVVLGSGLVALATSCGPGERRWVKYRVWAFLLTGLGGGALWGLDVTGVLQSEGPGWWWEPSWWWALIPLYPIGWFMGVWGPGIPRWVPLLLIPAGLFVMPISLAYMTGHAGISEEALESGSLGVLLAVAVPVTVGGSVVRLWKAPPGRKSPAKTERGKLTPLSSGDRWSRILIHVGSIAMMAGPVFLKVVTPVVVLGSGLVALGTFCGPGERRLVKYRVWVFVLIGLGAGAMWVLDANDLLEHWEPNGWWTLILFYPIGWFMGVWGPGTPRWVSIVLIPIGLCLLALGVGGLEGELKELAMLFMVAGLLTIGGAIIRLRRPAPSRK